MTTTAYAWAPITKTEQQDDGTLMVYGPAADAGIDRDKQRLDQAWLDTAMPKWMAEGGNVREMHPRGGSIAVGVATGLTRREDGAHDLAALVVDPVAVKKVQTGVLKGFSVGIKDPHITFGKADAPNGVVDGGDIIEVSLVDRPANPRTRFTMTKVDAAGELEDVEDPEVEETGAPDEPEPTEETPLAKAETAVTTLRDLLTKAETLLATLKPGDTVTTETTPPPAETPTVTKVDSPDMAAIVKAAVTEATTPLKDELLLVKADMAKVLAMPAPGGPVGMRTASQTVAARDADRLSLRAQAAEYLAKADDKTREDPSLAEGYRAKAAELLQKADA